MKMFSKVIEDLLVIVASVGVLALAAFITGAITLGAINIW